MEKKQPKTIVGLEGACWECENVYNITLLPPDVTDVKCECGGHVVSPSGNVMSRPIYDDQIVTAAVIELDEDGSELYSEKREDTAPKQKRLKL